MLFVLTALTVSTASYAMDRGERHGGDVVWATPPCYLHLSDKSDHPMNDGQGYLWVDWGFCGGGEWPCDGEAGTWVKQSEDHWSCINPKYEFNIHNLTAYSIDQYTYTGYHVGPDKPSINVKTSVASGADLLAEMGVESTFPTQTGVRNSAGTFELHSKMSNKAISASDIIIPNQDKGAKKYDHVSLKATQDDANNAGIACIIPVQGNGQWSLPKSYTSSTDGMFYLLPNILEAKVNLCVNLPTSATSDIAYQFKLDDFSNLEQDDITLYPKIDTQSTISEHIGSDLDLGVINFKEGDSGTRCVAKAFYFKTKENSDCDGLIKNEQGTAINSATISISMSDPKGQIHYMTLKPNSLISQGEGKVDGVYKLQLSSNEGSVTLSPADGGDKNTSLCPEGVCSDETITFNPS